MIRSMTGFGSAKGKIAGLAFVLELRSVNNRYFDLNIKCPRAYLFAEPVMKSFLQHSISRGKVDVFLGLDPVQNDQLNLHLNEQLAVSYRNMVLSVAELLNLLVGLLVKDYVKHQQKNLIVQHNFNLVDIYYVLQRANFIVQTQVKPFVCSLVSMVVLELVKNPVQSQVNRIVYLLEK